MTFQVTYTGDVLTRNIFYETPKNKGDEFTKKMNAIAKEIKKMQYTIVTFYCLFLQDILDWLIHIKQIYQGSIC